MAANLKKHIWFIAIILCLVNSQTQQVFAQYGETNNYQNSALPYSNVPQNSNTSQQYQPPQNQYPATGQTRDPGRYDAEPTQYYAPPVTNYIPPQNQQPNYTTPQSTGTNPYYPQGPIPQGNVTYTPTPKKIEPKPAAKKPEPEEIPIPDVEWYEPQYWCGPCWKGSVEAGLNGTTGNTESINYRFGAKLKRKTDHNQFTYSVTYARNSSESIETQHNALGDIRYDKYFDGSRWQLFWIGNLEYDEFKSFDMRLATNAGWGYQLIKTDCIDWVGRFGAGVSHELGGPDDSYVPEAVFGMDLEYHITKRQKIVAKVDYLPEWGDFTDNYRIVTDIAWEVLIDPESNLSLKIGAIDRYDSTPNGRKPNDLDYLMLLIWKM